MAPAGSTLAGMKRNSSASALSPRTPVQEANAHLLAHDTKMSRREAGSAAKCMNSVQERGFAWLRVASPPPGTFYVFCFFQKENLSF